MGSVEPIRAVPSTPPIKVTLGELHAAAPALDRLLDLRLPVRAAYHVAKLARLVRAELAPVEQERERWVRELGDELPLSDDQRAAGTTAILQVKPENLGEFQKRIAELAAVEIELAWRPLTLDELGTVELQAGDLLRLGPLVADEG